MQGITHVELAGTLTEDAELRYTPAGLAILEANLAGDDLVRTDDGPKMLPWYHRAVLFGAFAETIHGSLTAGKALYIVGRLDWREWTSDQGGRRTAVRIIPNVAKVLEEPPEKRITEDSKSQPRLRHATNRVLAMGNLTRDADLRYTQSGQAVANLSVAVNERVGRDQAERVGFYNATIWGDKGEASADLTKGAPVIVTGRLVNDSWTDRDGGQRFDTKIEVQTLERVARPPARPEVAAPRAAQADSEFPPEEDLPF